MEPLFEIQRIILEQLEKEPFYWREQFEAFALNKHICGILGSRGIGKTTFLLRHAISSGAKKRKALYVSADNLFFLESKLIDLVDYLYKQTDVQTLYIDEIHKYQNWKIELKNIADTYPSLKIFFSGSSTIDLIDSKYDLSRRVVLHRLCGLSFREYLEFYLGLKLSKLDIDQIVAEHLSISQEIEVDKILKHFNDYLKLGYYPFFRGYLQDKEKFQSLDNCVQMTIYEDIGTLYALKSSSLFIIEQLFKFIINSSPGEVNASKLSNYLKKDFQSISKYLKYLEQAGLIRFIYSSGSGKAFLKNPTKMYPENTNLVHAAYVPLAQEQVKGKIRETFFVNQVQNVGAPIFYSKKGDFKVDKYVFEIGGKNKNNKQIKDEKNAFVIADDIITGNKHTIPLYLFGFLY